PGDVTRIDRWSTEPRRAQARAGFFILCFAMSRLVVVWAQTHPCARNRAGWFQAARSREATANASPFINSQGHALERRGALQASRDEFDSHTVHHPASRCALRRICEALRRPWRSGLRIAVPRRR